MAVGSLKRTTKLTTFSGCRVRFTVFQSLVFDSKVTTSGSQFFFNLGDIDPQSVSYVRGSEGDWGRFQADTANDTNNIHIRLDFELVDGPLTTKEFSTFLYPEYGARFAEAFRHAVTLCGGKSSIF